MSLCCVRMHLSLHSSEKAGASITLHRLVVYPLLPHTSPQMSGYIASSSQPSLSALSASSHVTVRRRHTGHPGWDTKPINTSLGFMRSRAGYPCWVSPGPWRDWMEEDYVQRKKNWWRRLGAEAQPCLEHMVSPVILESVGHLWMDPSSKQALSLCAV